MEGHPPQPRARPGTGSTVAGRIRRRRWSVAARVGGCRSARV